MTAKGSATAKGSDGEGKLQRKKATEKRSDERRRKKSTKKANDGKSK